MIHLQRDKRKGGGRSSSRGSSRSRSSSRIISSNRGTGWFSSFWNWIRGGSTSARSGGHSRGHTISSSNGGNSEFLDLEKEQKRQLEIEKYRREMEQTRILFESFTKIKDNDDFLQKIFEFQKQFPREFSNLGRF